MRLRPYRRRRTRTKKDSKTCHEGNALSHNDIVAWRAPCRPSSWGTGSFATLPPITGWAGSIWAETERHLDGARSRHSVVDARARRSTSEMKALF
jgi:hypothetical protein